VSFLTISKAGNLMYKR